MSNKENKRKLNKNDDKRLPSENNNSNDDTTVGLENVDETKKDLTKKEFIVNQLTYAMEALNVSSTDSAFINIESCEEIFLKKVRKYKVIKHYIKGEKLGIGAFATVREFVHQKSLERIAGKIFKRKQLEINPYIMDHLENEFRLLNKFDHKNVIKLLDKYETDRKIYLFMEYGTAVLNEFLRAAPNHKLPQWQCHRYYTHIIEGLDYLHDIGIYHRDIKPDNLIVDSSDTIKICDFGVCHISDSFAPNDIIAGNSVGTLAYRPPELIDLTKAMIAYSGAKFDIWSSGVTLYQMVCGKLPFDDWDSIFKVKIRYPNDITRDPYLFHLFKDIFIKDFTKRISITDIKKHLWYIRHHPSDSKPVSVPILRFGDIYRSMTVLPRLESHYFPREESPQKSVSDSENDKTRDPHYRMSPTIRSNRKRKNMRSPLKQFNDNPAKRVLLGFLKK